MKKYFVIVILLAGILLQSCKKDFLDTQLQSGFDIVKISRWAYGLIYDKRNQLDSNITEILKNATYRSKRKEWIGRIQLLINRNSNK